MAGCFDDGGGNIDKRSDTPEDPYVRAVIADVEANYCVDKSMVFISGSSSGGWLSFTVGCSASDLIRGMGAVSGGLDPPPGVQGPAGVHDDRGPGRHDQPHRPSQPAEREPGQHGLRGRTRRDPKRNGCVAADFKFEYADIMGNAPHQSWDPAYPMCVKYTGCPAAYPVVWCPLDGGHQVDNSGGVQYKPGLWKFFIGLGSR